MNTNTLSQSTPPTIVMLVVDPDEAQGLRFHGLVHRQWDTLILTEKNAISKENFSDVRLTLVHAAIHQKKGWGSLEQILKQLKKEVGVDLSAVALVSGAPGNAPWLNRLLNTYQLAATISHGNMVDFAKEFLSSESSGSLSLRDLAIAPQASDRAESAKVQAAENDGASAFPTELLKKAFGKLKPMIVVFKAKENELPTVVWGNTAAYDAMRKMLPQQNGANQNDLANLLSKQDERRITWLRATLTNEQAQQRADIVDWDPLSKCWVSCRLYALGELAGGVPYYWYTLDWLEGEGIEHGVAQAEKKRSLADRFSVLADYLAKRWSISRLRLYQVGLLPQGLVRRTTDSADKSDIPHFVAVNTETDHTTTRTDFDAAVIPRFQSGMGWPLQGQDNNETPQHWWQYPFTWSEFIQQPSRTLSRKKGQVIERTALDKNVQKIDTNHHFLLEKPSPKTPCFNNPSVLFDKDSERLLLLIPQQPPKAEETHMALGALVAMDRCIDHLPQDKKDKKDKYTFSEEELSRFESASDLGQSLDWSVVQHMDGGIADAIRKHLGQWIKDDHHGRIQQWHSFISESIRANMQQVVEQGGMASLSVLCAALIAQWPTLWRQELEVLQNLQPESTPVKSDSEIYNWFFVSHIHTNTLTVHAGAGPLVRLYQNSSKGIPLLPPLDRVFTQDIQNWGIYVEQDFQAWLRSRKERLDPFFQSKDIKEQLQQIGSWIAVRLPKNDLCHDSAMIVHFTGNANSAWDTKLDLLLAAAKRLYAPFMLAYSELHQHRLWMGAVTHEIKNMAWELETLTTKAQLNVQQQQRVSGFAAQIYAVSQDYLVMSYDAADVLDTDAAEINIKETLDPVLELWSDYNPYELKIASTLEKSLCLQAPKVWQRVLRTLAHNAFRHGVSEVKITVNQVECSVARLRVVLKNQADATAIQNLQDWQNDNSLGSNRAFVVQRLGLRSAKGLCDKIAGAKMEIGFEGGNSPDQSNSGNKMIIQTLDWPLAISE